ncbi:peptidoglycan DD-metalloendopeptidase family protein [Alkalicoccobacillus gibsonii]|uniref:peptidoglycan DD-metalloendopeptidase family protein n=1 Tax=Alkalicoccobacillus gibsonii TaxID=79881 RepID=UPI003F7C2382
MSKELQHIRKRMEAKRKANRSNQKGPTSFTRIRPSESKVKESFPVKAENEQPPQKSMNMSGTFILRTFFCTLVFVGLLIIYQNERASLSPIKKAVSHTFEQEFQFAAISNWYESNFGRPIALLPSTEQEPTQVKEPPVKVTPYAVPASGTVRENFDQNGRGVMIETGEGIEVNAATGGYVTDVTDKEDTGKTVILQHYDGTESTYGMLNEITVNIYDHIQAGSQLGTVSNSEGDKGIYYFALKKGEEYINPNEVISFD